MKFDRSLGSSRGSILRALVVLLICSIFVYLLWLPIAYVFEALEELSSRRDQPLTLQPGEE